MGGCITPLTITGLSAVVLPTHLCGVRQIPSSACMLVTSPSARYSAIAAVEGAHPRCRWI